jgi:hypothetical protein
MLYACVGVVCVYTCSVGTAVCVCMCSVGVAVWVCMCSVGAAVCVCRYKWVRGQPPALVVWELSTLFSSDCPHWPKTY